MAKVKDEEKTMDIDKKPKNDNTTNDDDFVDDADNEFVDENDNEFENDDEFDDENDENGGWGSGDDITNEEQQKTSIISPPDNLIKQKSVIELDENKIEDAQNKYITNLSDELNLDKNKCLLLLRKFKWNSASIIEKYFENPDNVLFEAGVWNKKKLAIKKGKKKEIECGICMDDVSYDDLYTIDCGHQTTCNNCWIDYLLDGVKSKDCVNLPCPQYKCNVTIPSIVWKHFLDNKKHKDSYMRYLKFCKENFIENSKEFAFCPGKNCTKIYSSEAGIPKTVECKGCSFIFCWKCKNEAHFPASCHIGGEWYIKCSSEAENLQWILAKTKRCPKCKIHIEKNQGCNHMTCRKQGGGCGYEFCWLCKGDWKAHGSATGGYYQCNIYEKSKTEGKLSDEEKAAENAQSELDRYEFHWTRYDSHYKSSKHALKQRINTHDKMHTLSQKFQWRLNEAQFLLDAVNEAIKCWHVLAWTYPIAYYLKNKTLELFKQHQAQLEKFCDGLQSKLDFELDKLGDNKVRQEIINYTRTARKFRENLVEYIESEISF